VGSTNQIMHCRQSYLKRHGRGRDKETISEEICATCFLPSGMRLDRSSHSPTCCGKPKSERGLMFELCRAQEPIPNSIMTSWGRSLGPFGIEYQHIPELGGMR